VRVAFLKGHTMKTAEIAGYRQELRNILSQEHAGQRSQKLMQLAQTVGAGYIHFNTGAVYQTQHATGTETIIRSDPISEAELVLNINNALQTETMINALKSANRSWIVAIVAALIALGSLFVDALAIPHDTPATAVPTTSAQRGPSVSAMGNTEMRSEQRPGEKVSNANREKGRTVGP